MTVRNAPEAPIIVSDQTVTPPLWTIVRYVLTGIGFVLTNNGLVSADTVQTIIGAIIAAGPTIWGAVLSVHNKRKLIATAAAAPNSVAKVV
jgi:hypothetical protein